MQIFHQFLTDGWICKYQHEYLHSLGYLDEKTTRALTARICREILGEDHIATLMSENPEQFMQNFIYPEGSPMTGEMKVIEDLDNGMDYIG